MSPGRRRTPTDDDGVVWAAAVAVLASVTATVVGAMVRAAKVGVDPVAVGSASGWRAFDPYSTFRTISSVPNRLSRKDYRVDCRRIDWAPRIRNGVSG